MRHTFAVALLVGLLLLALVVVVDAKKQPKRVILDEDEEKKAEDPKKTDCALGTFNYMNTALGSTYKGLKKRARDAQELLREASWAERHTPEISDEEKQMAVTAASKEKVEADVELKQFQEKDLKNALAAVTIACDLHVSDTWDAKNKRLNPRPPSPGRVVTLTLDMLLGAANFWYVRYTKMATDFRQFVDESIQMVHVYFAENKISEDDKLSRVLYALAFLVGPCATGTALAMIILLCFPLLVGFHLIHDFMYQLWFLGIIQPAVPEYATLHNLANTREAVLHFVTNFPHHVIVPSLFLVALSVVGALVALPWTHPLFNLVTERARRVK